MSRQLVVGTMGYDVTKGPLSLFLLKPSARPFVVKALFMG